MVFFVHIGNFSFIVLTVLQSNSRIGVSLGHQFGIIWPAFHTCPWLWLLSFCLYFLALPFLCLCFLWEQLLFFHLHSLSLSQPHFLFSLVLVLPSAPVVLWFLLPLSPLSFEVAEPSLWAFSVLAGQGESSLLPASVVQQIRLLSSSFLFLSLCMD